MIRFISILVVCCIAIPSQALAYIGPGMAISTLGTVLLILSLFAVAIIGFVWFPIKRLYKSFRQSSATDRALD